MLRYFNVFCTSLGGIGVNLFFFLSGYGNYFSALKSRKHLGKWLWKRIATLLIAYLVCLAVVLGVLYLTGYRTTVQAIVREVTHLTIPYSSVWYVKIQLLVYVFLAIAILLKGRNAQVIAVTALCLLSAVVLFCFGLEDKWWKSTTCFALGVMAAAYRPEIEPKLRSGRKPLLIASLALFPVAYVAAILIDAFPVKTAGNLLLCAVMMALTQLLQMENRVYFKLGSYSLALYLVHRSFVARILDDGVTTVARVAMIVAVSVIFTIVAKWITDRITNRCFPKA